jgi:hypothetical protein
MLKKNEENKNPITSYEWEVIVKSPDIAVPRLHYNNRDTITGWEPAAVLAVSTKAAFNYRRCNYFST